MLAPVALDVQQQPKGLEIEETGSTYLENARLKASEVALLCGNWALADDSGLEVDALGERQGFFRPATPRVIRNELIDFSMN